MARKKLHKRCHVRNLTLPSRTVAALDQAGIDTVGKLTRSTPSSLMRLRGFGANALEQTQIALRKAGHGLSAE